MKLLDIINGPWAIRPEMLGEIQNIYRMHMRGDKIDIKAIEEKLGRDLKNEPKGYQVKDGVAVLTIDGVIAKRMNLMMEISGGVSSELIARDFKQALADPDVRSILLDIDSPGGTVAGTQELANLIFEARSQKTIIAYADGTMCSSAYWIGSAAGKMYISGDTVEVGSIGVVAAHVDYSEWERQKGIKTTEITAGEYKRILSDVRPLTESGRAYLQDILDTMYSAFLSDVAKFRGVSVDKVLSDMADGKIFIGKQAITAGLVDGVSTFDRLISELSAGAADSNFFAQAASDADIEANEQQETQTMGNENKNAIDFSALTAESLQAEAPDLVKKIQAESYAKGQTAELDRVKAVHAQSTPGHADLIEKMMFDGETDGGGAAVQVLAADKGARQAALDSMASDAPKPQQQPDTDKAQGEADIENLPIDEKAKAKWGRDPELRTEFLNKYSSYLAFEKASEAGRVKILSKGGN